MIVLKKSLSLAVALLAALSLAPEAARAQDRYPSKPVEMIVPWGPGGGADILGRLVGKWLEGDLKAGGVPVPSSSLCEESRLPDAARLRKPWRVLRSQRVVSEDYKL